MSKLTEHIVLSRTRAQDLNSVRKLNCWGSDLTDVQIVRKMSFVEVLSLSVNKITTLADFAYCKNLQELYLRKNNINDLNEVVYLQELPRLHSLWLADNPCAEGDNYRMTVLRTLPNLEKLDNIFVQPDEIVKAKVHGHILVNPSDPLPEDDNASQVPSPPQKEQIASPLKEHVVVYEEEKIQIETECTSRNVVLQQVTSTSVSQKSSQILSPRSDEPSQLNLSYAANKLPKSITGEVDDQLIEIKPGLHKSSATSNTGKDLSPQHQQSFEDTIPGLHNSGSAANTGKDLSPQHQQAFHARVRTLVDHSGRRIRKGTDLKCPKDACGSPVDGKQSGHGSPVGNEKQFSQDSDDSGSSGDGYRVPMNETTGCSNHHDFPSNNDLKSGNGTHSTPRNEKYTPQILPKGGKNRNANILSAILCLVKELDYAGLEVVETAIHCRMEEMED